MRENGLHSYLDLSLQEIGQQLAAIAARQAPPPGRRQVSFNAVETLLCYGLFHELDPHHFGGGNIDTVPQIVNVLAAFIHRTSGSILSKMLNLDGSRTRSAREEPLLFASLASEPARYLALYRAILRAARTLGIEDGPLCQDRRRSRSKSYPPPFPFFMFPILRGDDRFFSRIDFRGRLIV